MKKILFTVTTLFMLFISINNVSASSFNLSLAGDEEFSNEITIAIELNNMTDFPNGFYGFQATLNYDKEKLDIVGDITSPTNFDITFDKTTSNGLVALSASGVSTGATILLIKFKNIGLTENETTTISLTNILGSDGENDIETIDTSKTIQLVAPAYTKGDLNKNGKIDLQDIIYLLKRYLGVEPTTTEDIQIGDMDNSGSLGLKDVILLLKSYLGVN